jgi:PhnB protein
MSKVSTYLNFPQKTEIAFNFYKTVFQTEFGVGGIHYFDDIPEQSRSRATEMKNKRVRHVELSITGGHVLVGADAPESMDFEVTMGNNVFIIVEPDTKEETKRLYQALSADGRAIMPLEDMSWGAYFGSCTDKYGINWMFNCTIKQVK